MRRNIFIAGAVIGAVLVAFFYSDIIYLFTKNETRFRAIPNQTGFFVDLKNFNEIKSSLKKSNLNEKFDGFAMIEKASAIENLFTTLQKDNNPFIKDILSQRLVISFHLTKPGFYDLIFINEMNESSESILEKIISNNDGKIINSVSRNVRGNTVWDIRILKSNQSWTLTCMRGYLICSTQSSLVEDALLQLKGEKCLLDDKYFTTLKDNSPAYFHLYINYDKLSSFANGFSSPNSEKYLRSLSRFAEWTALSFTPSEKGITIDGIASSDNSQLRQLNDYSINNNQKIFALNQKPDNSSLIVSTILQTKKTNENDKLNPVVNSSDYVKYISPWFDAEASYILTEPVESNFEIQSLLFLRTNNPIITSKTLAPLNVSIGDSLIKFPYRYKNQFINQIVKTSVFGEMVPNAFSNFSKPYYTIVGNYAVFSNSLTQLKLYLERYTDKKTLEYVTFKGINTQSFADGTYNLYMNLSLLNDLFESNTSEEIKEDINNEFKKFQQFSPIYLQFKPTGENKFKVSGFIAINNNELKKLSQYIWKSELDADVVTDPFIVLDKSGDEKRIAVQDSNLNLYLLNRSGDILWKKKLDSPIKGEIRNIDFYKNEELQIIFATENKIYLLNDDGSSIPNFPISLPYKAVSDLVVLDMDKDRNYKYFITCENDNIYGFEKAGKPLQGWNPKTDVKNISFPVSYFNNRGKDFILVINNNNTLNFFDRKGDKVFKVLTTTNNLDNPFNEDNNGFSSILSNGTLIHLGSDGKIREIKPQIDNVNDAVLAELDGKPGLEKILLRDNEVVAFTKDTVPFLAFKYQSDIDSKLYIISSKEFKNKISVITGNKIFVLDDSGKLYSEFPVKGISKFHGSDLFNNGDMVITGLMNKSTIIAYLLNK